MVHKNKEELEAAIHTMRFKQEKEFELLRAGIHLSTESLNTYTKLKNMYHEVKRNQLIKNNL